MRFTSKKFEDLRISRTYKLNFQVVGQVKPAPTSHHALEQRGCHPPYDFTNINSEQWILVYHIQ
jgi:hypothetical protein